MKKKSSLTFAEMLATLGSSDMPADDFTWTEGSNYGMDGFSYDGTMNEGVLDGARLPETKGLSGLPDGLISGENPFDVSFVDTDPLQIVANGINLDTFFSEAEGAIPGMDKDASLTDLSWLDPNQLQNPDRLPKELRPDQAPLNSVPALEIAWGKNRQTNGLNLIPNKDKDLADYEKSLAQKPPAVPGARMASAERLRDAVTRALRRAHYGHSMAEIKQELVDTLGEDAYKTRAAVQKIEEEYGLLGTVFVRAAAFPGLKNGKWADALKRIARSARYVVTEDAAVATKLGMIQVSDVPWKKALAYYTPRLQAAGYKVASGDPQAALRAAFLGGPVAQERAYEVKPVEVRPADTISSEKAHRALSAAPKVTPKKVASPEEVALEKKRLAVLAEIGAWVRSGKLSREDALRLAGTSVGPVTLRKAALSLVQATGETKVYDGEGANLPKNAQLLRQSVWEDLATKEAALEAGLRQKLQTRLMKAVQAGLLTKNEATKILGMDKKASELDRIATMAIQVAETHRRMELPVTETKDYEGHAYETHQASTTEVEDFSPEQKLVMAASKASGIRASEFQGLLRWARQQMSEGWMGNDFDEILKTRWSKPVRAASKQLLASVRSEHEGLSGNIYVDASAYASKTGVKGCEDGALKHRTNSIPTVMAMPRCAGCVHARTMKDGSQRCGVYNKLLVTEVPVEDPMAMQAETIRMANASDAEVVASFFDSGEFNLQSSFDNLSLDNTPSVEKLGEILFGGLDMGEDES